MKPILSIVIPVYNVEHEIRPLLTQLSSIKDNRIEIVTVDDGSTDGSKELLEDFCRKNKNREILVHFIHTANQGLSHARNIGMRATHGKYIWFIDGDDLFASHKLTELINLLEEKNPDILQFGYTRFINDSEIVQDSIVLSGKHSITSLSGSELFDWLSESKIENFSWAHICKTSIYEDHDIEFPSGRVFEDIATTYQLFAGASKCLYWDYPLYHYRNRSASIMNDPTAQSCDDLFWAVEQAGHKLLSLPLRTDSVRKFLLKNTYTAFLRTYEGQTEVEEKAQIRRQIQAYFLSLKVGRLTLHSLKIYIIKLLLLMNAYERFEKARGKELNV